MARLLWLVLTFTGVALAFIARSSGLLGFGLLLGIVGFFGFVLAMAAERVSASARPDAAMASVDDLVALKKRPVRPVTPAPQQPRMDAPPGASGGPHTDRANV
jgi:hypothetical protein